MFEPSGEPPKAQSETEPPFAFDNLEGKPTEEQQRQIAQAISQAQATLGRASKLGCLGLIFRVLFGWVRFPRVGRKKIAAFFIGVAIVLLSVTTCSWGMDPTTMTAEYGDPVQATKDAANRLINRAGAAIMNAPSSRTLRLTVTEEEATSTLSLGMMLPEVMRTMETIPQGELESIQTVEGLRERLRQQEEADLGNRTIGQRIAGFFDPRLRTGDTQIRFTADGEIVVGGFIQAWRWQQPALIVVAPRATSGQLELDFVKGKLGRIPAPEWAFDQLGKLVSSLILMGQDYAEISELSVEQGRLTFVGRVTR